MPPKVSKRPAAVAHTKRPAAEAEAAAPAPAKRPAGASKPKPAKHSNDAKPAQHSGGDIADVICKKFVSRISSDDLKELRLTCKAIGEIHVSSACTGTNAGTFGTAYVVKHIGAGKIVEDYVCEKVPRNSTA